MMFKAIFSMKAFSKSNAKISTYTIDANEKFIEMNKTFKTSSFKYMTSLTKIMNKSCSMYEYPLLIMVGEYDSKLAHTLAKKWKRSNPNACLAVINNAGHCANMDNPKIFNEFVCNFLNRI